MRTFLTKGGVFEMLYLEIDRRANSRSGINSVAKTEQVSLQAAWAGTIYETLS